MNRPVLTESEVRQLKPGSPCYVLKGTLVTALARDLASSRQNAIIECEDESELEGLKSIDRRVALGADHGSRSLKNGLSAFLGENGYFVDCVSGDEEICDSPELTTRVANALRCGRALRGIMIDDMGLGACVLANKIPGIRAAHGYDRLSARNSREYLDANLLTLGAQVLSLEQAILVVSTWLNTSIPSGRGLCWIPKIESIEQRFSKDYVVALAGDCSCAL